MSDYKVIARSKYTQRSTRDEVLELCEVRKLHLYCVLFCQIQESGRPTLSVRCYYDSDVTLSEMCKIRSWPGVIYCGSFTREMYLSQGHPLWDYAEPIKPINKIINDKEKF